MLHLVHLIGLIDLVDLLVHLVAHLVHLAELVHLLDLIHLVDLIELLQRLVVVQAAAIHGCCSRCRCGDMLLVPSPRVGVVVYARMSSKLVRTAEALGASWKLAAMRLFSCMSANVSRLMLETMESLVAQRALVRTWEVRAILIVLHNAHGHGHGSGGHRGALGSRLCVGEGVLLRRWRRRLCVRLLRLRVATLGVEELREHVKAGSLRG